MENPDKFDNILKSQYDFVSNYINNYINTRVMTKIGSNMFDYSEIKSYVNTESSVVDIITKYHPDLTPEMIYKLESYKFIENEFIVIDIHKCSVNRCRAKTALITNYGTVIYTSIPFDATKYTDNSMHCEITNFDYINIINRMFYINVPQDRDAIFVSFHIHNIIQLLSHLKTKLTDGSYCSNYNMNVHAMNHRSNSIAEKEKEFEEQTLQVKQDLLEFAKGLNEEKEKLKMYAKKLQIEKTKLDIRKKEFDDMMSGDVYLEEL
jgi:hypothetical protein